jgi:hypothetical protein
METDDVTGVDSVQDIMPHAEDEVKEKKGRKKKRWGEETEAGKKILETATEPTAKKRKSRWDPEDKAAKPLPVPGITSSIMLPAAIAALVDLNPETLELQRQLNSVQIIMFDLIMLDI